MVDKKTNLNTEEMAKAGVHFGHTASKLHPKMKSYVAGIKNNVHMIDLDKTAVEFDKALKFIENAVRDGRKIIFVGTKIQAKDLVKKAAEECGVPYVVERWLGGTFTNFETLLKRVDYYKDLEDKKKRGDLEKYTKKERMQFDKELEILKTKFEGIKNMAKLPDIALIMDLRKDSTAAREARKKGITIVAVADTNIDPTTADYIIPGNDDAISSISYILEKVKETIISAKVN